MPDSKYTIVDAEWPTTVSSPKQAILDFIDSGKATAEIQGDKAFLANVVRAAHSSKELRVQVELRMKDGRLFIRRKTQPTDADS